MSEDVTMVDKIIPSDDVVYKVKDNISDSAHINKSQYEQMYLESINNKEDFWAKQAQTIDWIDRFTSVKKTSFTGEININWFEGGELNVSVNCIDRHLATRANQTAIIWEGDNPQESKKISYLQLYYEVCKLANVLRDMGVVKGDRVVIYMPMVVEAAYAMLACARIGAVHTVIFGGFSAESIKGRMEDCKSKFVITADEGVRGGKIIPLKANIDEALNNCSIKHKVLVLKRTGGNINWVAGRDYWYHEKMEKAEEHCSPEVVKSEDPLFILYTSGSTGKPKGVFHTSAGYLIYASLTHKYIFDYKDGDIYWCTADVGWITGHSYIVYGPLANGATTLMFEGVPNYPDWDRFWKIIDKHEVNIFYTAPTAIRALMREGDEYLKSTSRKSLKILGTVGEPINPEAWNWYYKMVGQQQCPIVDTWWQTETGGILITPLPGATDLKPGSATRPFFGVEPVIVDNEGNILEGEAEGNLCILDSWPGQMRGVYGDPKRFKETYFAQFPGKYFTGDGARRDKDGYFWITGRVDDVLNVSGHRLGTAEIESALVSHSKVAEAAVVGYPHEITGQGIYAFVILNAGIEGSEELSEELKNLVKKTIGSIAKPNLIQFTSGLPKTRSGKIMRRILRKIGENNYNDLGDTKTLINPDIVKELIENRLVR
jgi:acetyl-CoA synthetase